MLSPGSRKLKALHKFRMLRNYYKMGWESDKIVKSLVFKP